MPSGRTLEARAHRLGLSPFSMLRLSKKRGGGGHKVLQGSHRQGKLVQTEGDGRLEKAMVFSSQSAKREGT